jgi:deoxyribodipyrimidine photolyase-related protein
MKYYEDYIKKKYKCKTIYVEYDTNINYIFKTHEKIHMYDSVDFQIINSFKKYQSQFIISETPQFITKTTDFIDSPNIFNQTSFYIWQRKRLNILLDTDNKPIGGKWTYDTDNRSAFPSNFSENYSIKFNTHIFVIEAQKYINARFTQNIGATDLYLPIDHSNAKKYFNIFLKKRLHCFGKYQDAVSDKIIFGCHSVISPLINIGLITPAYIIKKTMAYYNKNKQLIEISSIEGFIRQIIGWREYMRYVYLFKHSQLTSINHFNHTKKITNVWYNGNTGIKPIDDIILKVVQYGYAHHIERLMYLGNFMLLMTIHPTEVHAWFMIMFLDSYHVFMEPNVYGMSQYSAGKIMSKRPYFSSSNYINKMSSYKKHVNKYPTITLDKNNYEWFEIWDFLYYNFIQNNKKEFSKNYAIASAVKHWNNKSDADKKNCIKIAKKYIRKY